MYKYKNLQAGQLPQEHLPFLQKFAEFYSHKVFEAISRWWPKRLHGWT